MIPRFLGNKEGSGGTCCDGGYPGGAGLSGRWPILLVFIITGYVWDVWHVIFESSEDLVFFSGSPMFDYIDRKILLNKFTENSRVVNKTLEIEFVISR